MRRKKDIEGDPKDEAKKPSTEQQQNGDERGASKDDRRGKSLKDIDLLSLNILFVSSIIFILFYYFIGSYRLSVKRELTVERDLLWHRMDSIREQISSDSLLIEQLKSDDKAVEKYVREHFYMHKADEEVFVIETE